MCKDEELIRFLQSDEKEWDKELPEYQGKSLEEIQKEFPDHKILPIDKDKPFPFNVQIMNEDGTTFFIFQEDNFCNRALFFSN